MKEIDELYGIAEGNFGLVTYSQAKKVSVGISELDRWVKIGKLEKVARGVYRFSQFPAGEKDSYAIALESVAKDAYLYGESVLDILNLVPTNPGKIYVATPRRVRKRLGSSLELVKGDNGYSFTYYEGLRSQYLKDAIRSCRGHVRKDRRLMAIDEGLKQGYITRSESKELHKEITNEASA